MNVKKTEETCSHHHLLRSYIIWVDDTTNTIFYDLKDQGEKTKVVKMDNNNNYNYDIKVQIINHEPIYTSSILWW
jgi:hypothetical protein